MTPWLELCRAAATDVRGALDALPTREAPTITHRPRLDLFPWPLAAGFVVSLVPPVVRLLSRSGQSRSEKRRAA